jgi:hypothetical protein
MLFSFTMIVIISSILFFLVNLYNILPPHIGPKPISRRLIGWVLLSSLGGLHVFAYALASHPGLELAGLFAALGLLSSSIIIYIKN